LRISTHDTLEELLTDACDFAEMVVDDEDILLQLQTAAAERNEDSFVAAMDDLVENVESLDNWGVYHADLDSAIFRPLKPPRKKAPPRKKPQPRKKAKR
jgi:tetrahydromethanopterin S-methyltransferase subunit B